MNAICERLVGTLDHPGFFSGPSLPDEIAEERSRSAHGLVSGGHLGWRDYRGLPSELPCSCWMNPALSGQPPSDLGSA
jgi:hypothetical protein